MAAPTFAEVWTQLGHRVNWFEELEAVCSVDATNLNGIQDSAQAALEGEYVSAGLDSIRSDRAALSAILEPRRLRSAFRPYLREFMRVIGKPEKSSDTIMMRELREYMVANSETINRRDVTFNAWSAAGGNTGDGNFYRLTVDKDGHDLDNIFQETKTAECEQDQGQVRKHGEVFLVEGEEAERDFTNVVGSGIKQRVKSLNARDAEKYVQNPSFDRGSHADGSSPSSTTAITGWTIGSSASNVTMRSRSAASITNPTFRGFPGDGGEEWAVEFTANDSIEQILRDTVNPSFRVGTPYVVQVAVMRRNSATGTVTLEFGSQTANVSLSTLTNDVWSILNLPFDKNLYYDNFLEDDLNVKITVASLAVGTCVIDDVIVSPMTKTGGTWDAIVGGQTAWLRGDSATQSNSISSDAVFGKWFWRAGLGWLPSVTGGTETVSDP